MPSALKFSKSPTKRPGAPRLKKHTRPRTLVCLYFSCLFSVMQIVWAKFSGADADLGKCVGKLGICVMDCVCIAQAFR
jgi:hypothetical protein